MQELRTVGNFEQQLIRLLGCFTHEQTIAHQFKVYNCSTQSSTCLALSSVLLSTSLILHINAFISLTLLHMFCMNLEEVLMLSYLKKYLYMLSFV